MNKIARFIHEFTHPHCVECENDRVCKSCETLKQQLDMANEDKRKLLELILEKNKAVPEAAPIRADDIKPIKPSYVPWNVRRQYLEQEDRESARIMRSKEKEQKQIEDLEKEIGIASTGTEKSGSS